jgi:hypothetical protein
VWEAVDGQTIGKGPDPTTIHREISDEGIAVRVLTWEAQDSLFLCILRRDGHAKTLLT